MAESSRVPHATTWHQDPEAAKAATLRELAELRARVAELEAALRQLVELNSVCGPGEQITPEVWAWAEQQLGQKGKSADQ